MENICKTGFGSPFPSGRARVVQCSCACSCAAQLMDGNALSRGDLVACLSL